MRKILLVITKANWGGAQKYVFEVATKLPKDSFEVKVICGQGEILNKKLENQHIPVIQIPQLGRDVNMGADNSTFLKLFSIFWKEKPDVVHLNSSKIGGLGALAARLARVKKIVFTVHGFAFNEDRSFIQKLIIKIISWLTLILATDVICISKREYTQASSWPFVSKKLHLIYNGISIPAYKEKAVAVEILANTLSKPTDFFSSKKIVGTIAELTKNKGLEYAIQAFKDIDALYIIIGGGEQKEYLTEVIKKNGLEQKVFLAGFIQDASTLLKVFDVFLLPSLKEGVPYVLLEAGYAKVPIISTNVGGVSEIIDDTTGTLIPSKSTEAIEESIKKVMSSDTELQKNALYKKIAENFSQEKMIEKTQAIYN